MLRCARFAHIDGIANSEIALAREVEAKAACRTREGTASITA